MKFDAKPSLRRQNFRFGPFFLWRARARGRGREGLVCFKAACRDKECMSPHLSVRALVVPGSLAAVISGEQGYSIRLRSGAKDWRPSTWYGLEVDVLTGEVKPSVSKRTEGQPPAEADAQPCAITLEDALSWLRSELDGELLEEFYDDWLSAKGWERGGDSWKERDWSWWKAGDLVPAEDLLPGDRPDCYLLDGKVWQFVDYHCVKPSCDCLEVRIQIVELEDRKQVATGGHLKVVLPEERVTDWEPEAGTREQLERLWEAYQARHRGRERLAKRNVHAKECGVELFRMYGRPVVSVPTSRVKAGRNDPCPCGSGKKYKRCCLGQESSA